MTMPPRKEKKSELLEVRVTHSDKIALMETCKQVGTNASTVIRQAISEFIDEHNGSKEPKSDSPWYSKLFGRHRTAICMASAVVVLAVGVLLVMLPDSAMSYGVVV